MEAPPSWNKFAKVTSPLEDAAAAGATGPLGNTAENIPTAADEKRGPGGKGEISSSLASPLAEPQPTTT